MVEVGVKELRSGYSSPQIAVVKFFSYPSSGVYHRTVAPIGHSSPLGDRHDRVGRRAPQLLRTLKFITCGEFSLRRNEKLLSCLRMLISQHILRSSDLAHVVIVLILPDQHQWRAIIYEIISIY